jgi:Tfp pilus assembly protein PilO
MLNDAKMGWMVAVAALLISLMTNVVDFGRSDQKVTSHERQLGAVMSQQAAHAETIAKLQTQFLDVERRLNAADRQMQSMTSLDSRLAKIEVIVELIGRQVGAPVPATRGNVP